MVMLARTCIRNANSAVLESQVAILRMRRYVSTTLHLACKEETDSASN